MLGVVKLNSKTSNNSARLVVATLAINIARLVAAAFAVFVAATPFKLAVFAVLIAATSFKYSAYKAIKGCVANSAS